MAFLVTPSTAPVVECRAPCRARRTCDQRTISYVPDDPLLAAAAAAAETGRALSTFWRDVKAGRLPPAYYVAPRSPRWRRSELRAAVDACRRAPTESGA
jgi:predicted DNA-binding transcriptional regulator AlpA